MPEMSLTNDPTRVQHAVEILRNALIAPAGKRRSLVMIKDDTSNHGSTPPDGSCNVIIKDVRSKNSWIVISPQFGVEISLPVSPIVSGPGIEDHYQTHISHIGSFLSIVKPYFFYDDRHRVDFMKWCFVIPAEDEDNG